MGHSKRMPAPLIAVAIVLSTILVSATISWAGGSSTETASGSSISRVKAIRTTHGGHVDGTYSDWTDLPGASTSIRVAKGRPAFLLIDLSFAGWCYEFEVPARSDCHAQAVVDGEPLQDVIISSPSTATSLSDGYDVGTVRFSTAMLSPGTHDVSIRVRACCASYRAIWSYWHLTVERVDA